LGNAIAGSAIATGGLDKHLEVIVRGVAGSAMQAFGEQLSDTDVAAVMTYQRNAFGNNTGDVVQASDVVNYKQG
jgi:cytochrome c oxidase subunit 2